MTGLTFPPIFMLGNGAPTESMSFAQFLKAHNLNHQKQVRKSTQEATGLACNGGNCSLKRNTLQNIKHQLLLNTLVKIVLNIFTVLFNTNLMLGTI